MTQSQTIGFSLFDAITRILPGSLFVFFVIILLEEADILSRFEIPSSTISNLIIIGLLAFLVGELIHLLRETIQPVPPKFRRVVYAETEELKHLSVLQRLVQEKQIYFLSDIIGSPKNSIYTIHLRKGLVEDLKFRYDLEQSYISSYDIYSLTINSVDAKMSSRTKRYKMSYDFSANLFWSIILSTLIYFITSLFHSEVDVLLPVAFLMLISVLVFPIIALYSDFVRIQHKYVDSLITDYFVNVRNQYY